MGKEKLITSPFESERDDEILDGDFNNLTKSYDLFTGLQEEGKNLDKSANEMIKEVETIIGQEEETIKKNLTFKLLFQSIKQTLREYKTQTALFESYVKAFEDVTNEENIVKVLDILREILKERKMTINDVISHLVKIQKLTNDRIKIDKSDTDEDVEDLLNPDEI